MFSINNLKTRSYLLWYFLAALVGLLIGGLMTYKEVQNTDTELRNDLLVHIKIVENAIDWQPLDTISPEKINLADPTVIAFRAKLQKICKLHFDCKSIYIMYEVAKPSSEQATIKNSTNNNKHVVFLMDSLNETDSAYAVPRTVYEEASAKLRMAFNTRKAIVEGPIADKYGNWVSASVPHVFSQANMLMLAVDVDARDWNAHLHRSAAVPITATVAYLLVIFSILLLHIHTESERTRLQDSERIMRHASQHDSLTGLPNRLLLNDRLKRACLSASRNNHQLAVLFIDLDGFKRVNDQYGHEAGDVLLIKVAKRLNDTVREEDTIARVGGDEFVVVLPKISSAEQAKTVAEKIVQMMSLPFKVSYMTHNISASIGIMIYPTDSDDPQMLIALADRAMYLAKQKGKNQVQFFDS